MKAYFDSLKRKDKLLKILEAWKGVPYRHMGDNKAGVDCTKFLGIVCVELGLIPRIEKEYYGSDWFLHSKKEVVIESIENYSKLLANNLKLEKHRILVSQDIMWHPIGKLNGLLVGDILLFAMAKSGLSNHCGVYIGNEKIVHAINRRGVGINEIGFSWASRATWYFRLMEIE